MVLTVYNCSNQRLSVKFGNYLRKLFFSFPWFSLMFLVYKPLGSLPGRYRYHLCRYRDIQKSQNPKSNSQSKHFFKILQKLDTKSSWKKSKWWGILLQWWHFLRKNLDRENVYSIKYVDDRIFCGYSSIKLSTGSPYQLRIIIEKYIK